MRGGDNRTRGGTETVRSREETGIVMSQFRVRRIPGGWAVGG
jgi:hypothetical protein